MSSLETVEAAISADPRPVLATESASALSGEVGRSLVVSAVALVVDYGLMVALHDLAGMNHLLAATAGFCAGLTTNYLLSVMWVFRSRSIANRWLEFAIFAAVGVAGLGLTLAIMYLGTDVLGGEYRLVRLVAVGLVFCWNFGVRKLALFRGDSPVSEESNQKRAIIIGAGPAGLTAAYELLTRSNVKPIVLETSDMLGGIARTVNYKGNRIDIGGHRFFSKSDRVMQWWADMLPLQNGEAGQFTISYQGKARQVERTNGHAPDPARADEVMLVRPRKSRIYFLRKFFDYPISLSKNTIANLGLARMARIGASYTSARLFPVRNEKSLEDFLINRFGRELYLTFFKSYTEKVWGVPCHEISAAWGAQRIKGLSISKAILHALKKPFRKRDVRQKGVETSLVEQFLYPKYGPGQMWEVCSRKVRDLGGEIHLNTRVERLHVEDGRVKAVETCNAKTGEKQVISGDYFFSTMPIQELVRGLDCEVPAEVREISEGLVYRDFITVGLLLKGLKIHDQSPAGKKLLADNWIYVQEPEVKVGRLQIFNNWSPYMVADPDTVWIGLEYFCYDTDELWKLPDAEMSALGVRELAAIGIIDPGEVLDSTVIRMPKTYPAYFGSYERFDQLRSWLDGIENLFLVGRNGMHRYNNQDHSMLTAMTAVDNILAGRTDKANIWDVNTEQEYHEAKGQDRAPARA